MLVARIEVISVSDEGDQVIVWGEPEHGGTPVGFVFPTKGPGGSLELAERASRLALNATVVIEYHSTVEGWNLASGLSDST